MPDLSGVNRIFQDAVKRTAAEWFAIDRIAAFRNTLGAYYTLTIQFLFKSGNTSMDKVTVENTINNAGIFFIYDKSPFERVVTERWIAAHPHAFLFTGGNFIADPLCGDFTLELGEAEQDI